MLSRKHSLIIGGELGNESEAGKHDEGSQSFSTDTYQSMNDQEQ